MAPFLRVNKMERDCFCGVLPAIVEEGTASVLVGVISRDGRKSLRCLGGQARDREPPARCALRNVQDAVFGLLGNNSLLSKELVRKNRAKTEHGFAWVLPLNPRSKDLVVQQQLSVSGYLKHRHGIKPHFQKLCWVTLDEVRNGASGATRPSPQLLGAVRALSSHPTLAPCRRE